MEFIIYLLPIIFALCNRGRGSDNPHMKIITISFLSSFIMSALIGQLFYNKVGHNFQFPSWLSFCPQNWIFIFLSLGFYLLGESFGWAKWQAGIVSWYFAKKKNINAIQFTSKILNDNNDNTLWIDTITRLTYNPNKKPLHYSIYGLNLRGTFWWLPLFSLFYYFDLLSYFYGSLYLTILSISFPLSNIIAAKFDLPHFLTRKSSTLTDKWWAQSEVFYGFIQGLVFMMIFI